MGAMIRVGPTGTCRASARRHSRRLPAVDGVPGMTCVGAAEAWIRVCAPDKGSFLNSELGKAFVGAA